MAVECAFGRLKERFRILKSVMSENSLEATVTHTMSCFVLHNILISLQDDLFWEPDVLRDRNINVNGDDTTEYKTSKKLRSIAKAKRDGIAKAIFNA